MRNWQQCIYFWAHIPQHSFYYRPIVVTWTPELYLSLCLLRILKSIFMPIYVRPVYCHHSFVSYARPSGLLACLRVSICQVATSSGSKRNPKWQVMAVSPSSAVVPRNGTCSPNNCRFTSLPTVSPMETRRGPSYSEPAELRRTSY